MSCGVGLDPALLWLWHRPVATALVRPLAWEPPHAVDAAQEMAKRQKKKKRKSTLLNTYHKKERTQIRNIFITTRKQKQKKGNRNLVERAREERLDEREMK